MPQYPTVQPAAPINPVASLADLMNIARSIESMRDTRTQRERETEAYERAKRERETYERVMSPQNPMAVESGTSDWQGPVDPRNQAPALSREQILSQLPASVRATAQKDFDEYDDRAAKAVRARREAREFVNDHVASSALAIARSGYNLDAARYVIGLQRETYADDPEVRAGIDKYAQQIEADPRQLKPIVDAAISLSPKIADQVTKIADLNELDLSWTAANDPDETKRNQAQAALTVMRRKEPEPWSLEDYASKTAQERAEIDRIRGSYAAAVRAPEKPEKPPDRASLIAGAESRKFTRTEALQKEYDKTHTPDATDSMGVPLVPMPEDQFQAAKDRIERAYKAELGRGGEKRPSTPELEARAAQLMQQIRDTEGAGGNAARLRDQLKALLESVEQ